GDRATSDRPSLATRDVFDFAGGDHYLYSAWRGSQDDHQLYWAMLTPGGWGPWAKIEGAGSLRSPAITHYRANGETRLFMVCRGVQNDQTLYWMKETRQGFDAPTAIKDMGTDAEPAVADFNGTIYLACKGIEGDSGIYWSAFDGNDWAPKK